MRLIGIECEQEVEGSTGWTVVNTAHIASVFEFDGKVVVTLSNGNVLVTKFTDVNHATDYIQRASSHSFTGTET